MLLYSVFLQVGFTVPQDVTSLRGSLLHYLFTLARFPVPENLGGLFSVALSVVSRHLGVTQHSALWSSDFPLARKASDRLVHSSLQLRIFIYSQIGKSVRFLVKFSGNVTDFHSFKLGY